MLHTSTVIAKVGLSVPVNMQYKFGSDFKLEKALPTGTFTQVHLADAFNQDLCKYGKKVAVKTMKNGTVSDHDVALFKQEVSIMAYFREHRNFAKILGYTSGPYSIVMKYYALGSLGSYLKQPECRNKNVVHAFARDIASGLMAMHQRGLAHLDLKADNVLMDFDERGVFCVLTDYGTCQVVDHRYFKLLL